MMPQQMLSASLFFPLFSPLPSSPSPLSPSTYPTIYSDKPTIYSSYPTIYRVTRTSVPGTGCAIVGDTTTPPRCVCVCVCVYVCVYVCVRYLMCLCPHHCSHTQRQHRRRATNVVF
jgi:hypothetical protein